VSDWHTLVTWDEIYPRAEVTKADLIAQVQRIGVNRGLRLIAAIDNIAFRDGASRPDTQVALATEFTKTSPLVSPGLLGEVRKGRIAFAPESLAILAGYIVQHGLESSTRIPRSMLARRFFYVRLDAGCMQPLMKIRIAHRRSMFYGESRADWMQPS